MTPQLCLAILLNKTFFPVGHKKFLLNSLAQVKRVLRDQNGNHHSMFHIKLVSE